MKRAALLSAAILLALSLSSSAGDLEERLRGAGLHVAELTDADLINLRVNKLQQAIQQEWTAEIEEMLSVNYAETDPRFTKPSVSEQLEHFFSAFSRARGLPTRMNPSTGWKVTATQDFYIQASDASLHGDKATVECRVGFFSLANEHHSMQDTLRFIRNDNTWRLAASNNLFGFLKRASEATLEQVESPAVLGAGVLGTKDDFVSSNMLVPVNLFVFDGTPVPRFNRTTSMLWFGYFQLFPPMWIPYNIMAYPFGIVADVLISGPPGKDVLNHNFLFVSDVAADKIVTSYVNDWVTDFGSEGTGESQFQEPHGLACLSSSFYFVADELNNRVLVYEYYDGWTYPLFHFALEAGFYHPRDVDAKEGRPGDPQDVTYIAVADMGDHRVVIFRWPYDFSRSYGQPGSGEGQFHSPTSVCFGRDPEWGFQTNDLYITDKGNHRLVRIYIGMENTLWRGCYQFPDDVELTSVDVDNKGLIYVVDRQNGKVYKLAPSQASPFSFSLLGIWGETGAQDGQLYYPNTIQVAHGHYCPYPNCYDLNTLGDVFVTESWTDETGVRRFVIAADVLNLSAEWVPLNEDTGEGNYLWWDYDLTDFGTVTEEVLRGAEVCTTYNRGVLNWGGQGGAWPIDGHPHGAYYTVKVTATSIYAPTIVVEKTVDVYVDTLTIHNPVITQGIRCNHESPLPFYCDDGYHCIQTGHFYTVDVQAYDPDGYPLTYEWSCARGWLCDQYGFYKDITTTENHVCYIPPDPPGKGPDYEKIMVDVKNSIGGESGTSLNPGPYLYDSGTSCLCGDVCDNGIVNVSDVVYLVTYLYRGGPEPVAPKERADVNNDCIIDVGDLIYLRNYLYRGGPAPECCWLHEWIP